MKKIIITTAIILSASMSFYAKQSASLNKADVLQSQKSGSVDKLSINYNNGNRLDIGQADAGN